MKDELQVLDTLGVGSRMREASPGFEPGNDGFANRCLTTWRRGRRLRIV